MITAQNAARFVRVRSPQLQLVRSALDSRGAGTTLEDDGSLSVRGIDEEVIGELAAR